MSRIGVITEEPYLPESEPQYRGGRIFVSYLARHTEAFIVTSFYKRRPRYELIDGTPVYRVVNFASGFLGRVFNSLKLFFKLVPIVRKERPEVLLAKTSGTYLPAFLASRMLGIKVKLHLGSFPKYQFVKTLLLKLPYEEVIVTGEHIKKEIEQYAVSPVRVVENGIDFELFKPRDKKECREQLGLPQDEFIILYAGGFEEVKRLPWMLEIFAEFVENGVTATLVLVGEGPQAEQLRELVRKKKLEESVVFRGSVAHSKLSEYYNAADVFLLTSRSEGGSPPRGALEAMACNTPVISIKQKDSDYIGKLGVKTAATREEYVSALEEAYNRQDRERHLRDNIQDFSAENRVKELYENTTAGN